jgi:hypothetical protein
MLYLINKDIEKIYFNKKYYREVKRPGKSRPIRHCFDLLAPAPRKQLYYGYEIAFAKRRSAIRFHPNILGLFCLAAW